MKKILALAAAAALAAGASAYAANPFSDVSTSDWAYQAVSDLSDQGIVEGYPDGTFKGETNITRYELAQIVARLMAKEDQYTAEQRATIDKLAGEYADELDSLGVRVSNLEKKVGNISWSGDARMRYTDNGDRADESWTGRIRINAKAQVNEDTVVNLRLSTGNVNFKDSDDADVYAEKLNVVHSFGKVAKVTLGRYGETFGNQGGWLYGNADGMDGAKVDFALGKVGLTVGYGQLNAGDEVKDQDLIYAKAKADLGAAKLGVDYLAFKETNNDAEIWGVNLLIPVGDFRVFGDYYKDTVVNDYDTAWNAGIGYGKRDLKKPGSFSIDLAYNDVDYGVYGGGTGLQTNVLNSVLYNDHTGKNAKWDYLDADNVTFWNAIAEVTLQKNVYLHAEYAFDVDAEHGEADASDSWTVSLNYVF